MCSFLWFHQAIMMSAAYQISYFHNCCWNQRKSWRIAFLQVLYMSRAQTNRLQCHVVLLVAQKCHTWPLNNTKWESSLWRVWYLFWGLCNTYMVTCCYQKIDSVKQYFPVWVCLHLVADYLGVWEKQDRNSALTRLHHACVLHCAYTAQIQRGCQWKFCISFLRVQRNWEK